MTTAVLERLPGQAICEVVDRETDKPINVYGPNEVAAQYLETAQESMNLSRPWEKKPFEIAREYEIGALTLRGLVDAMYYGAEFKDASDHEQLLKAGAAVIDMAQTYAAIPYGAALEIGQESWKINEDYTEAA